MLFAARGTSDHAALYAKYLVEIGLGLPAGLASPSALTVYGARPDLRDVLLVAVSQSGGSPDLVETARRAKDCGARVLAVTNAPSSELASVDLHVGVGAGTERAVAATKTYSAELLALWLVVQAWRGGDLRGAEGAGAEAARHLERAGEVAALAAHLTARLAGRDRLVLTARGYAYATAREAALKLMETAYLSAHAFSGADLMHGPIAMVSRDLPVLAVAPAGAGADALAPVLASLRERGAELAVFGTRSSRVPGEPGYTLGEVDEDLAPDHRRPPAAAARPRGGAGTRARPRPPARPGQGHPHLVTRGSGRAAGGALRADAADPDLPDLPVVAPPHEVGVGARLEPPEIGSADQVGRGPRDGLERLSGVDPARHRVAHGLVEREHGARDRAVGAPRQALLVEVDLGAARARCGPARCPSRPPRR